MSRWGEYGEDYDEHGLHPEEEMSRYMYFKELNKQKARAKAYIRLQKAKTQATLKDYEKNININAKKHFELCSWHKNYV